MAATQTKTDVDMDNNSLSDKGGAATALEAVEETFEGLTQDEVKALDKKCT